MGLIYATMGCERESLGLSERVHDTEFEFFWPDRLDDIVSCPEGKYSSQYIDLTSPTQYNDRDMSISLTYHLDHPISSWLSSITRELEISDDDIIGSDEGDLSGELERWVYHADPIGDHASSEYSRNLWGEEYIIFYDEEIHI